MHYRVEKPSSENFFVEIEVFLACLVNRWIFQSILLVDILFESESKETLPGSPGCIIEHGEPISEENLSRVATINSEINLCKDQDNVLIEIVANHFRNPNIAQPAVNQEQPLKEPKLGNSVIGRPDSLGAFFAPNSHSNVGFHYHGNVVRSVSYAQCYPFSLTFGQTNYVCFLLWGYPAAYHTCRHHSKLEKCRSYFLISKSISQSWSINYYSSSWENSRYIFHFGNLFRSINTELSQLSVQFGFKILLIIRSKYDLLHVFLDQLTTPTNFYCSFLLISSQNPELNLTLYQFGYSFRHLLLQFVFYCRGAQVKQVLFLLVIIVG